MNLHPTASDTVVLAGIGLKHAHFEQVLGSARASSDASVAGLDFFEVHAENHMVDGGPALRVLERIRERWPLSIHGVGLSIGGEAPLDAAHLDRLAALVQRFEPRWVSEHLAWSSHGGVWLNDLLPLPYNASSLAQVCRHLTQVQERLRRPVLLENPSTYLEFAASTYGEAEFLREVQHRTGCGLLLDVNNAFVSAVNHGRDAWAFINALPAAAVGEIHLAGFAADHDADGSTLLIDDHGDAVSDAVWALYRHSIAHFGPKPTLIERDSNIPPFASLAAEAARAKALQHGLVTRGSKQELLLC